jgi:uncharacterized protein (DUF2236 family)
VGAAGGEGGPHREADPRLVAMVLGAAIIGLAAAQPMLAAGVGPEDEDHEDLVRRCVRTAAWLAACVVGAEPTGEAAEG